MRKSRAHSLRKMTERACKVNNVAFTKTVYRRVKKIYKRLPWNEREDFNLLTKHATR